MIDWTDVVAQMQSLGIDFAPGLTDAEVRATEVKFRFEFPPDLRAFLQVGLPRGEGFPDWRSGDESKLRAHLDIPRDGILFDIERNGFWLEEWGSPKSLEEAKRVATDLIAAAPKLIPIYMHRMMPCEPREPGNPVFSVHQTDIIYYGFDLLDYVRHEFELSERDPWPERVHRTPFWDLNRFQTRWDRGPCVFDNKGILPS